MELFKASNQYATRPNDECYDTVPELYQAAIELERVTFERSLGLSGAQVAPMEAQGLELQVPGEAPFEMSYHGMGKLCRTVGAPASYLRGLEDRELVADCLNHGLRSARFEEQGAVALIHEVEPGEHYRMIALNSEKYQHISNAELIGRLLMGLPERWKTPPTWTGENRGLYLSQKDMFVFMVDGGSMLEAQPGGRETLHRGFFLENAHDGSGKAKLTMFYFNVVCGNHIVWGATQVKETAIMHRKGQLAASAIPRLERAIRQLGERSGQQDHELLLTAQGAMLGKDRDEVVEAVFKAKVLPRRDVELAYEVAVANQDKHGDPRTAWGVVNGITRMSKALPFGDKRTEMDRAASKVLDLVWS